MSGIQDWRCWCSSLVVGSILISCLQDQVLAQITPDNTLPKNSSVVRDGNTFNITGGTQAGSNLFHSFREFSVPAGGTASFNNALDIQNIIGRVTGGSVSNINGLIQANGTANLFLINPNGIIFGQNAQLNIGGSFVASTASSLKFADSFEFSTTSPITTPLLTVSVPIGLQYGKNPSSILNQSRVYDRTNGYFGLQVKPGKTLALIGGNVSLDGGGLTAIGGRVELGGVTSSGRVDLSVNGNDLRLNFPNEVERADVFLTNAGISANSLNQFIPYSDYFISVPVIPAGSIVINARNIDVLEESYLGTSSIGNISGQAGEIVLNSTGTISVTGTAARYAIFQADGTRGVIKIKGKSILTDYSLLSTVDFGGNAGTISLQADESLSLTNSSVLSNIGYGQMAGEINLKGKSISIIGPSQINAFGTFGISGNININASDSVIISNSQFNTFAVDKGRGGNINIKAGFLLLTDGAQLNAGTSGNAPAGNIIINADSVTISGVNSFGSSSGLFTSTEGVSTFYGSSGKGGDIKINAGTLRVLDGAVISAKTTSDNNGGNIVINTTNLEINNGGQFLSNANSAGQAGDITINATGDVVISGSDPTYAERSTRTYEIFPGSGIFKPIIIDNDGPNSGLFARVQGDKAANAGNIEVTARNLRLDNQGTITTETTLGDGGDITLNVKDILLLRNNSSITATAGTAQAGGNGGNITIKAPNGFIVAVPSENSDITANAFTGSGGRVDIQANGIYGIEFRESPTVLSDITASSEFGTQGTVELNILDINPNSGLVQLPTIPVDTKVAQGCYSPDYAQNRFVIAGRGGLPLNPKDILTPDAPQIDWVSVKPTNNNRSIPPVTSKPTTSTPKRIIEATGATLNAKGQIVLSANSSAAPYTFRHNPIQCHGS